MKAEFERFATMNSPLHRWDARWKLISLFIVILIFAAVQNPWMAFMCLILGLIILSSGKLPFTILLQRLGVVNLFFIPVFILLPIRIEYIANHWTVDYRYDGFILALLLYLRALSIIAISMAILYSTPMNLLLRALERLKIPRVFIQIILLTYRYIFTFASDVTSMRWALTTRGFRNRSTLRSYQILANMAGLLLVRSLERTNRIYRAMQCRGYDGSMHTLHTFHTKSSDLIKTTLCLGLSVIIICLDIYL